MEVTDSVGATATQLLSLTVTLPTLSINGGGSSAEVPPSTNVSMAFNLYDQANGANDIGWAQFYLSDSSGNAFCYGDWGRDAATGGDLDLYDSGTGVTHLNQSQSDSFCTVSLVSITNSSGDPTELTVVLNFSFNPGPGGTYNVMTQVNYGSGYAGPWEAVGTLTIDPAREFITGSPLGEAPPQSAPILTPPDPISVSTPACGDVSGTWSDPTQTDGSATWSLTQTGTSVQGTLSVTSSTCGSASWTVSGTSDGTAANFTATNPSGNWSPTCVIASSINVSLAPGCAAGAATVSITTGGGGSLVVPMARSTTQAQAQAAQVTFTRSSNPPGLTLTTNLYNDCVSVEVTGPNQAGNLSVTLNGPSSSRLSQTSGGTGCVYGPSQGTLTYYGFGRTSLQPGQYTGVTATWNTTSVTTSAGSPTGFYVLGLTRFSQYNTPYASDQSCQGTPQQATIIYKIDSTDCWYQDVMLPSAFISRVTGVGGTGTGIYNNTVLKGYNAGAGKTCPLWGNGFNAGNTFYSVDSGGHQLTAIIGANWRQGYVLSDGRGYPSVFNLGNQRPGTVATDANITPSSATPGFQYGDAILLFDQGDNNDSRLLRSVQDKCPACSGQFGQPYWGNTVAHIDMYNGTNQSCSLNNDYGQYYAIRLR